jgi:hypothetical protein
MMLYILIFGALMAAASAVFWCAETVPFVKAVHALHRPRDSRNPIKVAAESAIYIVGFLGSIVKLWPLGIDILCTVWLAGAFGFSGMIGGVIGLTISNVISAYLVIISRKGGQRASCPTG